MSANTQKPLPFQYQFAAGAVAGVSEILVMYPLDVVKTRVQLQSGTRVAGEEFYTGMFDCLRKIVKNEGASRLYRGISAPILMEAPKRATKFAANDSWGSFYRGLFGVDKQTQSLAVLTGATAGATESFVVVPFELVKIRLQDRASKYNGMLDVVKKIVQTEGPLALYNGLESTLWRHILWNAGYFGCIFQVRAQLPKVEPGNKTEQTRNDLIAGTIGGTAGTILNTPMDVVKSRIQNSPKVAGQTPKYNWAWPAVGTVMKEEGFGALYKGFIPKVLRLGPGGGILLVVFTGVMDFFRTMRGENA
ncbi:mitochondrial carrier domain-containing protein [Aspergillus sergii]|uniref:Mitochondrial carrier domain-containing protein n=1 Tax=Aspergillus sergii TaxID=1034303 RepID=A0A5N6XD42_9EURO|nr:mitochondrial carrier domain-containing protein [Aspergillus sergii]